MEKEREPITINTALSLGRNYLSLYAVAFSMYK